MRIALTAWMLALLGGLAALAGVAPSAPANAAELRYFYCYAPNPETGITYVSDVHPVGPVVERRNYGEEFARFLRIKGMMREGGVGYCVMRATMREIDRGRTEMTQMSCRECADARRLEDIAWPRGGEGVKAVLVGLGPKVAESDFAAEAEPAEAVEAEEPARRTLSIYVRDDATDAVAVANDVDSDAIARARAERRGGEWRSLVVEQQCHSWVAVAAASSAGARHYWLGYGTTEAEAMASALRISNAYAKGKGAGWDSGIVAVAFDPTPAPEPSLTDQVGDSVKAWVRSQVIDPKQCRDAKPTRFTCMCVRG